MSRAAFVLPPLLAAATLAAPPPGTVGTLGVPANDTCTECHQALDDERLAAPARLAERDIHHRQGITCAACHGGDPRADDGEMAMSPAAGFVARFAPGRIPEMCASCHADASFMLRYAPNIPTDQYAQYRTSHHGRALAEGDGNVATCASCHGAHGVLPADDARSPVYPTRIVDTCGHCHADASLMHGYGVSGNEVDDYKRSVHFAALTEKNDLSAPTCNDCHGSHGATPPGVESVANVCGTCHVTQFEMFDASPHKEAFAMMEQPACEACHSNHAVAAPRDEWIGINDDEVCGQCHGEGDAGADAALVIRGSLADAATAVERVTDRVGHVERAGMLVDDARVALEESHQALVLARNAVHTVAAARVAEHAETIRERTTSADSIAAEAEAELRYRRTGLFISLLVILVAIVALALKIRQIESS